MAYWMRKLSENRGQSLVLILLILVIGAVVAFAIAARTIQDMRRTARERLSDQAGTQVETILDVMTSKEQLAALIDFNTMSFVQGSGAPCDGVDEAEICRLDLGDVDSLVGGVECEEADVQIRFVNDGAIDKVLTQDEVLEVNLASAGTAGDMNIVLPEGGADYVTVKVYGVPDPGSTPPESEKDKVVLHHAYALTKNNPDSWENENVHCFTMDTVGTGCDVHYEAYSTFARIRVIGVPNSTRVDVTGVPPQDVAMRATCYISDIYREFVRQIPIYDSVPECFDYVLFDGDTLVDEFGGTRVDNF